MQDETIRPSLRAVPADEQPCQAHFKRHWPEPIINELHHVVPQAWQATWAPAGSKPGKLWDPRTVSVCPTGHRSIHWWIPYFMRNPNTHIAAEFGPFLTLRNKDRDPVAIALVDQADYDRCAGLNWNLIARSTVRYAQTSIRGRKYYLHRFLIGEPGLEVHHRNGNGLDNRRANIVNLARAEHLEHTPPKASARRVHEYRPGRWRAFINVSRERVNLGCYGSEEEAREVADEAVRARLTEITDGPFVPDLVEPGIALQAPSRFAQAGGDLQMLRDAGQWGYGLAGPPS